MRWSTNVAMGVDVAELAFLAAFLLHIPGLDSSALGSLLIGATLGSLLPDLDARESKIKFLNLGGIRPFEVLSILLNNRFGHRGLLHSIIGLASAGVLAGLFSAWLGFWCPFGIFIGYMSHIAADLATVSGLPLLYPHKNRQHLIPRRVRIVTGSQAEEVIFTMAGACAILFIFYLGRVVLPLCPEFFQVVQK